MNAELMCQYIEFVADRLLVALGCPKHYNSTNPITEIKKPSDHSSNQAYEAQICHDLDRRERCRQFDIATVIREAGGRHASPLRC